MFGEGAYEGLFAAETANNGVTGGALVPLLTLGIPGDTITAVLMGALTIQGLTPGPMLFQNNPEVITGIYTMLLICNIFMIILGLAGTRLFMHVIKIPNDVLLPCVMLLCFIGSFASGNKIFDVGTAVVMGIIGFLFTLGEIPAAPCLLGIILGSTVETNFRRAMVISNGSYSIFCAEAHLPCLSPYFARVHPLRRFPRCASRKEKDRKGRLSAVFPSLNPSVSVLLNRGVLKRAGAYKSDGLKPPPDRDETAVRLGLFLFYLYINFLICIIIYYKLNEVITQ